MSIHHIDKLVGSKIRARRIELGLSQWELAHKLGNGATKRKIECYESGQRAFCSVLYEISRALKCEPGWFFKDFEIGGKSDA